MRTETVIRMEIKMETHVCLYLHFYTQFKKPNIICFYSHIVNELSIKIITNLNKMNKFIYNHNIEGLIVIKLFYDI